LKSAVLLYLGGSHL